MEIDLAQECEIESDDLAVQLVPQFSPRDRFDVLLVADAPVDVSESRRSSAPTLLSGPEWLRDPGTLLLAWTWRCWVRPMSRLGLAVEVV